MKHFIIKLDNEAAWKKLDELLMETKRCFENLFDNEENCYDEQKAEATSITSKATEMVAPAPKEPTRCSVLDTIVADLELIRVKVEGGWSRESVLLDLKEVIADIKRKNEES